MAVTFTSEQQMAIDLHGCNILVSAAAGSGKTAVLVERIVQMVCEGDNPVDIDHMLIVTFTNAAAAEMRERIAAGISKRLSEHPDCEHIQKQSTLLHNAQITTIDSFCLFLLRNHFNEIGLDPAFRIADEGEIRLMQQDVLRELIEDSYASGSDAFRYCVEYFCPGGRESVLEQHILNLSRYAASFPWPARWLARRKEDYAAASVEEMCASPYGAYLAGHLRHMAAGCADKMARVRSLCQFPDGPYMYGELVDEELERLEELAGCGSLEEFAAKLPAVSFGRLSSKKDETVSAVKRELAKEMRSQVKDCIRGLADSFFATPTELAARQGAACREPVCTLIDLVMDFDARMREKKQEKKVIDFSDMEHYALDILLDTDGDAVRPSAVALEYREYFAEILTDEYQDSNLVQEYLLNAISGEEGGRFNRFMVGDVKQSIYKFRLARPELFLEKYNTYEEGGGKRRRIDLSRNFRSRRQVVEAVNDCFARLMSRDTGGIPYDHRAALYPGAAFPENQDCESEALLVEKPGKDAGMAAREAEGLEIARKIKELRGSFLVTDREDGKLRPAKYCDMVILLRTNSGWDEEFKTVLEREGIPVYITSKTGYFAASEVQELLQLLRVLDNPCQDIPLFGVMKSIFGGFSEEEAARIRSHARGCSLYDALKAFASDGAGTEEEAQGRTAGTEEAQGRAAGAEAADDCLREKTASFLKMIADYRGLTVYLPVRELLARLSDDFGYLDYVTALPSGSRRRANVEMLFTKASDFEKTSYFGLFHFIRYMEQLEKYEVDYGEAGLLDENADVVRIMSIHKSKGLEFPVVFVSGLGKRFNMQDANQSLILDMDLGLGCDYVDPERRIRNKTLRRMALARKLREDSLSEELRVLYVAMTRAREKLVMTGVLEDAASKWERQQELGGGNLTYLDFMEAGSYLDFLLPVLPDSSLRVSVRGLEAGEAAEMAEQMTLFQKKEALERAGEKADAEAGKRLLASLNTPYPYGALAGLYTKTTVSELKIAAMADRDEAAYHAFEEKEVLPYIPLFRKGEEKISGAVRGNAYHKVMELLNFEEVVCSAVASEEGDSEGGGAVGGSGPDASAAGRGKRDFPGSYQDYARRLHTGRLAENLHGFLQRAVEEKRLSEDYFQAVRERKIVKFLRSSLAYRMWRAQREGTLYREQPFVLGVDARRLKSDFPEEETVLIQGIIDVFFVEEDGLVLLDYKTDGVSSLEGLWNRYETQMDYYREAVERLMGRPVKERILYSFHLEEQGSRG